MESTPPLVRPFDEAKEADEEIQRAIYQSYSAGMGGSGSVGLGNSMLGSPRSVRYRWYLVMFNERDR